MFQCDKMCNWPKFWEFYPTLNIRWAKTRQIELNKQSFFSEQKEFRVFYQQISVNELFESNI